MARRGKGTAVRLRALALAGPLAVSLLAAVAHGATERESSSATRLKPEPLAGVEYEVRAGDSLERVGARAGCTVWELRHANALATDVVFMGARLKIPTCAGEQPDVGLAPATPATPATPRVQGQAPTSSYRVAGGDTWGGIAQMSGCSLATLHQRNGAADLLRAGDYLRIPDCAEERRARVHLADRGLPHTSTASLAPLLHARGFTPPEKFRALVTVLELEGGDSTRKVTGRRRFEAGEGGVSVAGWNPASTVKLYSATAALLRLQSYGFTRRATVEFRRGRRVARTTVARLVRDALVASDNAAHDRLVQLAGFEGLHRSFLSPANGFARSAILGAYGARAWMRGGEAASLRDSPTILIREGGMRRTLEAETGAYQPPCGGSACTSLRDLSEAMARIVLGDQLPRATGDKLSSANRRWVMGLLATPRERGDAVVDHLRREISKVTKEAVNVYHKAGYSQGWYSDVAYIDIPGRSYAYIVALAGYPGRDSLDAAAQTIGAIVASGVLE